MDRDIYHLAALFRARLSHAYEASGLATRKPIYPQEYVPLVRQALEKNLESVLTEELFDPPSPTPCFDQEGEDFLSTYTTFTVDTESPPSSDSSSSSSPQSGSPDLEPWPYETPLAALQSLPTPFEDCQAALETRSASLIDHASELSCVIDQSACLGGTETLSLVLAPGEATLSTVEAAKVASAPSLSPSSSDLTRAASTATPHSTSAAPSSPRCAPPPKSRKPRASDYLAKYVRVVEDDEGRKFQCTVCGHTSSRAHDVKRHVTKHDVEAKPHECLACHQRFRRTDARGRHWAKNPECYKIDEALSRDSKTYSYRHGRKNSRKSGIAITVP